MKVLKSETFQVHKDLVKFVERNGIKREDIFFITSNSGNYAIFYYAEP